MAWVSSMISSRDPSPIGDPRRSSTLVDLLLLQALHLTQRERGAAGSLASSLTMWSALAVAVLALGAGGARGAALPGGPGGLLRWPGCPAAGLPEHPSTPRRARP